VRLLLGALLLAACSSPPVAARDGGRDASFFVPRDAWFGDTNAADSGPCASAPTFADVQPILVMHCAVTGCHARSSPEPGGGLVFDRADARSELVGLPCTYSPDVYYVIPGDVGHSFLFRKLTNDLADGGTEGAPMPLDPMPWMELAPADIDLIRCWIATGAH